MLGARGSQLQLVLNTVFHLETSPGNIPWTLYQEIRKRPTVELAVPYAVGDNYQGFRVVGTTEDLFARFEYRKGERFRVQAGGRFFDSNNREAVIGSFVAARTGHAWAYATAKGHETRASFYTLGSLTVIVMALWALAAWSFGAAGAPLTAS